MSLIYQWKKRKIIRLLGNSIPQKLLRIGEDKLIPAFQDASKNVPSYSTLLRENNIDRGQVKDMESFKRLIPIVDKEIFNRHDIRDLCKRTRVDQIKRFSVSSGFSGGFSYGLVTEREQQDISLFTDALLDYTFGVSGKKTLWISALGMGVKVYTRLPLAETSVRSDMVLALIKKLSSQFEQFIIIGNPYFVKKIIEDGVELSIDWKSVPVHLIMGEDWFPESFRSYLAHIMGIPQEYPYKRIIGSSMGICELGLSLFQESAETIRIRQLAQENEKLRHALFGRESEICPMLFHYHPYLIYLEEINGELVFTTLSKDTVIPLIRYASRDRGMIYTYGHMKDILVRFNYQDCIPKLKLPFVSVGGRKDKSIEIEGISVSPEEIKSGIYSDFEAAAATTGYFRMSKLDSRLRLEVQLKEGRQPTQGLNERFSQAISKYAKKDLELCLYPYKDFPYGMGLIYEQKFKYI